MATIPQELLDAFQAAFDAAATVADLQSQYAAAQSALATLVDQIRVAGADRDAKEQYVVALTAQLLGPGALPPTVPPSGPLLP